MVLPRCSRISRMLAPRELSEHGRTKGTQRVLLIVAALLPLVLPIDMESIFSSAFSAVRGSGEVGTASSERDAGGSRGEDRKAGSQGRVKRAKVCPKSVRGVTRTTLSDCTVAR